VVLTNPQRHTGGVSSWTTTGTRAAEATAGIAAPCSGITRLFREVSGETAKAEAGWRREWDSNPRYARAYNGFRDRPVRPLRHPSVAPRRVAATALP
jgi:hypothetical protein